MASTMTAFADAPAQIFAALVRGFATLRITFEDPILRAQALESGARVAAVVVLAALAAWIAARLVSRAATSRTLRFAAEIVAPITLVAVAHIAIAFLAPSPTLRDILIALVLVTASIQIGLAIGRLAFNPEAAEARLVPLDDSAAFRIYLWIKRILVAIGLGFAATRVAEIMNASPLIIEAIRWIAGGAIAAIVIAGILGCQRRMARLIAGNGGDTGVARLRRMIAGLWHLIAIVYVLVAFAVWGLHVPGGFAFLAQGTAVTFLAVVLVQFCLTQIERLFERLRETSQGWMRNAPAFELRAAKYLRKARIAAIWTVRIAGAVAILLAWQIDLGALLATPVGAFVAPRLAGIAGSLLLAYIVWEIADATIAYHLDRRDANGQMLVRNQRLRTLLPLIRNAIFLVIGLLTALSVLSQIGVNVMPLIAGAGVVGLAIGFGSQTLVKDVITGMFILAEDTVNVGDVANINGTGGFVEGMTIRTIKLRDMSGVVHTIPFGAITQISNLTKDFSFYLLEVSADYRENTDRVIAVLREIFADLAADPAYRDDILDDLEVMGVDKFEDSAVKIVARIKTRPIRQWTVGREFNRRMKLRFDELGIVFPVPRREIEMSPGNKVPPDAAAAQS